MDDRTSLRFGEVKKKLLLLLAGGLALSLSGKSFKRHLKIYKGIAEEWREINRSSLTKSLDSLYNAKLIDLRESSDGIYTIILSREGKNYARKFNIDNLYIEPQKHWDGKWRIVLFDVPERFKKVRDALRFHFKKLGLVEYQKSVFIYPYPCEKEIKYVIECYGARSAVHFIVAEAIDNTNRFRRYFKV